MERRDQMKMHVSIPLQRVMLHLPERKVERKKVHLVLLLFDHFIERPPHVYIFRAFAKP